MDKKFLVLLYSLSNIEITKYLNEEPRWDGFYSKDNLSSIKDGKYVINLEKSKEKYWDLLFIDRHMAVYFELNISQKKY